MPDGSIDPGSLEGDALTQWYLRSPAELERERQAAAAKRYQDFFYGPRAGSGDLGRASATSAPASASDADPRSAASAAAKSDRTITYGALRAPAPSDQELAELRRQQAAFADTTRKIDLQNSWFAAPALAAPLAAMGLEGAAAWAARTAAPEIEQAPLQFIEREPYLRVGDNWATRAGRRAHSWLEQRLAEKPDWKYEPDVPRPDARPLKPDVGTPQRNPANLKKRYYLELKPDTPTGRAAAARAVKKYIDATEQKVRAIYYNPKDFM
jgi:hypothetical protein